jgi:glucokinase
MASGVEVIPIKDAQPPFFAGIDLGGTDIKLGVVDDLGRTVYKVKIPTETEKGPEDGSRRMGQFLLAALDEIGLKPDTVTIGLGTPGPMDIPAGMLIAPHNLPGWYNFPIRDRVSHYCGGLPVKYANDAISAAYGEYWIGNGQHLNSMVLLTLGTGVGGGIITNDMLIEGEHSTGSHCGHLVIDCREDARICPCGGQGHLEAYAGGRAVVDRTLEALKDRPDSSLKQRLAAGDELTPLMIAQEAERGDALSREIVMQTARYLGAGVVSVAHVIDPDGVLLGGAMTFGGHGRPLGREFLEVVRAELRRLALPPVAEKVSIDFASLGGDAGYIGAAGIARLAARKKK